MNRKGIVTMAVAVAVCEIFGVKEWCDLENRVRSRSLVMTPFDRSHTTSYSPSVVTTVKMHWAHYSVSSARSSDLLVEKR